MALHLCAVIDETQAVYSVVTQSMLIGWIYNNLEDSFKPLRGQSSRACARSYLLHLHHHCLSCFIDSDLSVRYANVEKPVFQIAETEPAM